MVVECNGRQVLVADGINILEVNKLYWGEELSRYSVIPSVIRLDLSSFLLMKFVASCWSCSWAEKFWKIVFQVATLEVVLAAEEIRWTFSEEKFVRWIDAGQVSDLIFDLAWVALLSRWRVSIFGGRIEILSFLMLMKFVASC